MDEVHGRYVKINAPQQCYSYYSLSTFIHKQLYDGKQHSIWLIFMPLRSHSWLQPRVVTSQILWMYDPSRHGQGPIADHIPITSPSPSEIDKFSTPDSDLDSRGGVFEARVWDCDWGRCVCGVPGGQRVQTTTAARGLGKRGEWETGYKAREGWEG